MRADARPSESAFTHVDHSVAFLLIPHPHSFASCALLITYDRPPAEFIPPVQEPYQYIIFRASEVKDLAVDEPPPRRSVHDDPAVLGVRVYISHHFAAIGGYAHV